MRRGASRGGGEVGRGWCGAEEEQWREGGGSLGAEEGDGWKRQGGGG